MEILKNTQRTSKTVAKLLGSKAVRRLINRKFEFVARINFVSLENCNHTYHVELTQDDLNELQAQIDRRNDLMKGVA